FLPVAKSPTPQMGQRFSDISSVTTPYAGRAKSAVFAGCKVACAPNGAAFFGHQLRYHPLRGPGKKQGFCRLQSRLRPKWGSVFRTSAPLPPPARAGQKAGFLPVGRYG